MKKIGLFTAALLITPFLVFAQINATTITTDATCSYSSDGTVTISQFEGIYAPITAVFDSSTSVYIPRLKNDDYNFINQGAAPSYNEARGVWSGPSSIGDVYITTGYFTDSVTFDSVTVYGNGAYNMFVACFNSNTSNIIWAKAASAGSGTYVEGYGVTGVDDKVYVTGYLEGTTNFGSTSISSTGGYQMYIAQYDIVSGALDTVIQAGGSGEDYPYSIKYAAGRLYIAGLFNGTTTYAGNNYTSTGNYDAFVTVFDTSLNSNYWFASGGGTAQDLANDLVVYETSGAAQNIYVVGEFRSTATFGFNSVTSAGNRDFFIASLDTNGTWQWVVKGGSNGGQDRATSVDVNNDGTRLYVSGVWGGNMTFGGQNFISSGIADGFISYLDNSGALEDLYAFSSTAFDHVIDIKSIDNDYLVFVAQFGASISFADSSYAINGATDAFIGLLGPNFYEIWGKDFGGPLNDAFHRVSIGENNYMNACGYFYGDASYYQSGLISMSQSDAIVTNDYYTGVFDTTIFISGLAAGDYYLVLSDSNGSLITDTITISSPSVISTSASITITSSGSSNDGAIDLTATGGTPGYTYNWSNSATSEDVSGLSAGNYTVTITDSNGCVLVETFFVDSGSSPLTVIASISNVQCNGDVNGSIDITVTGGVPPYNYSWSNGASTQDLSGLAPGNYVVTITDNDTSIFIDSFDIIDPPILLVSGTVTPPSSGSASDGAINVNVSGGTPPYSYLWNSGGTTQDLINISIGFYNLTVTDSSGCQEIVGFVVDTIATLKLVFATSDVTCLNSDNGSIDLTVIGGTPPYTFIWSNAATTEDISMLSAGTYTVTVSDNNSQTVSDGTVVGSNPQFPDPIVGPISGPTSVQAWTTFNYSVPTTNGSAFLWTAAGGNVASSASNAASILWGAGPDGLVYVTETDEHGCSATDSSEVSILFVGIYESTDAIDWVIFPVPASDKLSVIIPSTIKAATLYIRDNQGQLIVAKPIENSEEFILLGMASGIYTITLETATQYSTKQLIIE